MTNEKSVQGVFDIGVSGMGPALSPLGESIVNAKREKRNELLSELKKRGLDIDVLTHGRYECAGGLGKCSENCVERGIAGVSRKASSGAELRGNAAEGVENASKGASEGAPREALSQDLEKAREVIRLQRSRISHLEYQVALQENKIFLLREALEAARDSEGAPGAQNHC